MVLHVTKHAIIRYRERTCDYSSTDKVIVGMLKRIVSKGYGAVVKSGVCEKYLEVGYKDISIVLVINGNHATVLTCLGNDRYRKWIKQQSHRNYLGGRVHLPKQLVKRDFLHILTSCL